MLVFLDKDTFLKLEDVSQVLGSIDTAISKAINILHDKIFLSEDHLDARISEEKVDVDLIVSRIEERLVEIIRRMPLESTIRPREEVNEILEIPEFVEIEGGNGEEEPELEDVLEEVAVVELDESLLEEEKKNEEGKTKD